MSQVRDMWASVAPGWETYADANDERGAPVTGWLLSATAPAAGDRVLELAGGPGGAGLAAARAVGAEGEVVITDLAPEMAAIAARRAAQLGLANVRTGVADLEAIDQPDGAFEVVLCREGLMFAGDPRRGAAEMARVLRPGGRLGVAVWGPREENPWLGLVLDVVGAHLGLTLPPPGVPGPFSLSSADELASVLGDAGLVDVAVDRVAVPYGPDDVDHWWTRTCACAGPVSGFIAALSPEEQATVRERAIEAVQPYVTDGQVRIPGLTLVASARRARV